MEIDLNNISARIMVIDDHQENLELLHAMLKKHGHEIVPCRSGKQALQEAKTSLPDLFLLDINMPEMNGYEVCKALKNAPETRNIPVIFVSAMANTPEKVKAFQSGGVDFITKPFHVQELNLRINTHLQLHALQTELETSNLQLEQIVQEKVREISEAQIATIFALSKLAESRDQPTGKHLERVQNYCRALAEQMMTSGRHPEISPQFISNLKQASILHDIGKVTVSRSILQKPGPLTADEFETIKKHTIMGAETLNNVLKDYPANNFVRMGAEVALNHHEKWDGSGYPGGLKGLEIPLSARIIAVADVYDALVSERPYKPAYPHTKAYEMILAETGKHFDPDVIEAFIRCRDDFKIIHARYKDRPEPGTTYEGN